LSLPGINPLMTMSTEGPFEWLAGGLFFGKNAKGGIESIDSCKDALVLLQGISQSLDEILADPSGEIPSDSNNAAKTEASDKQQEPTPSMFLAARLARLRFLLYDERRVPHESSSRRPTVVGTTLQGLTGGELQDLVPKLLENIAVLPFESRKHVAAIFNYLLVAGFEGSDAEVYLPLMCLFRDYVELHVDRIMTTIVNGLDTSKHCQSDVGLHYGSMYRACLRHPCLYRAIVGTTDSAQRFVFPLLDTYVHNPNFDIASDSMETLRLVLAGGDKNEPRIQQEMADIAAEFLTRDYEEIWTQRFNPKLLSESANYMTRRVALQILSAVLLTRSNYAVMIKFVASRANLILVMKLLRDTSPHITLDAFHVFKVFVANPNKPPEIVQILKDNKVKLCKYLATLHKDKEESDTQFRDEKALIIATIDAL
jgi:hypothetical protein